MAGDPCAGLALRLSRGFDAASTPNGASSTKIGETRAVLDGRVPLLIHPFFFLPEQWNGMDEHLLLLSRHLDRREFDLALLTHATDGPQTQILAERAGMRAVPAPYGPHAGTLDKLRALRHLYAAERV